MTLPTDYVRRAVYAKYFLRRSRELMMQKTSLASGEALLTLQDGAEMLIRVVADQLGLPVYQSFMEFWPKVKTITGTVPPHHSTMDRLNQARVGFKHKGNIPNSAMIAGLLPLIQDFCECLCSTYLNLDFDTLGFADLISDQGVRSLVQESEKLFGMGSWKEAMEKLALAFLDLYASARKEASELLMKPPVPMSHINFADSKARELSKAAQQLSKDHMKLADTMNMILLGIDPRAYLFFKRLTPGAFRLESGKERFYWHPQRLGAAIDERRFQLCRDFIIDFSLRNDELFRL